MMFGLTRARALRTRNSVSVKVEEISISGRSIEISRRAYKRSLGLTLKMNGTIRVSAPKGLSLKQIRDFVESQERWIVNNLAKYERVRAAYPRKEIREGEVFPFLGSDYTLVFEPIGGSSKPCFKIVGDKLVCGVRREVFGAFDRTIAHPELMPALVSFYKKKAREILSKSVLYYSQKMELFPSGVSFRGQRTRWGSCSSKGRISLNWKLIVAPLETLNYVVVHELSHLRHYNHSAKFWALVATQVPDFISRRDWLRENQFLADFLSEESELHP